MRHYLLPLLAAVLLPQSSAAQQPVSGLRAPEGFEVTEFAGSDLANDIYTLTISPGGDIAVAGRGYIRTLADADGDGRADKATTFAVSPKDGAMGMLWEGDTLYVTGDGGLRRFRDADGDGQADGPSELIRRMGTGGEHAAHAIRRGPDGWLYVLCGNHAKIDASYARTPASPVAEPTAGCLLRFSPDLKTSEIVAHGFRNAYGMDFNPDGEIFAYDSDNERCVSLPWYEPTRFYHVIPGGFCGWLSPQRAAFWRCPPYFVDVVAPAATLGRGSPTGVVCYRHTQFPAKYRGGLFALDWTFGKVHFLTPRRDGSSYTCEQEVFLEALGDSGFAPTGAAVHPGTGDLYVSIGGRGTRGAVYRVRYTGPTGGKARDEATEPIPLDWSPRMHDSLLKLTAADDLHRRRQALESIRRHADRFTPAERAAAVYAAWDHPDQYLRQAAARLIATLPEGNQARLGGRISTPDEDITFCLARHEHHPAETLGRSRDLLRRCEESRHRLEAVRLMQLALGGIGSPQVENTVWEGYTARKPLDELRKQFGAELTGDLSALRAAFPTGGQDLDRELSRTLAALADDSPVSLEKVAAWLRDTGDPVEQLHYLIVLGRLRAPRGAGTTRLVADTLLSLDRELDRRKLQRDRHWPLRVGELYAELAARDDGLHAAVLRSGDFGRPAHALFALAKGFDRKAAANSFLRRAESDADFTWTPEVVSVVAALPAEQAAPVLRKLWGTAGVDAAILPVLARRPDPSDRDKFLSALQAADFDQVRTCLDALRQLPPDRAGDEALALLSAWRRLAPEQAQRLRTPIVERLRQVTGQKLDADPKAWSAWFTEAHPDLADRLNNRDGVDLSAWQKRLAALDWDSGDAGNGRKVFLKANCAACHSGGNALGPDLAGVTGRFSRDDLVTAVLQPNRDVSPRYQSTLVETTDGKFYQGLVIYEATDGVILQTAAAQPVRVPGDRIAAQRPTPTSLMPAGLLDPLSDREIADLFAYLRTLGKD